MPKRSHLNQANLAEAILDNSDLRGAYLTGACLNWASLQEVDLRDACLVGIDLKRTNLTGAFYNECTKFPSDFNPLEAKMFKAKDMTVQELLPSLVYVYGLGCQYLGPNLATKYWEISCPNRQWLKQFSVENKQQITFLGNLEQPVSALQLRYSQEWTQNFINTCSKIIGNFANLIDSTLT
ncbi:pentapeptide repeat-containing protein [Crocosphaera sp. XPORK-15E]|nr:pentapeptide repeat-containing protein [Crocosphaera sp. XPORK-15E]